MSDLGHSLDIEKLQSVLSALLLSGLPPETPIFLEGCDCVNRAESVEYAQEQKVLWIRTDEGLGDSYLERAVKEARPVVQ